MKSERSHIRTFIIVLMLLLCACGARGAMAESANTDIPIDDMHFPDECFRAWCLEQAWGSDKVLTNAEAMNVNSIDVSGTYIEYGKIESLNGIEYFPALTELRCGYNQISELDMTRCAALTYLDCSSNNLIRLDVAGCTALTDLICFSNIITELDVTGCAKLTCLSCSSNNLTELDVTGCAALETLYCDSNNLTELNVTRCAALWYLYCDSNNLTQLDVTKCAELGDLSCAENKLTELDVSKCKELNNIICYDNDISQLNVTGFAFLMNLDCENNNLTELNVSGCTALEGIYCSGNSIIELNVSGCTALEGVYCSGNNIIELDVSGCTALKGIYCSGNSIIELDVTECTILAELYCSSNKLTKLDASGCASLTGIYCSNNNLTELDVTGCAALEYIYCPDNNLTELNVSTCTTLRDLSCEGNHIAALDLISVDQDVYANLSPQSIAMPELRSDGQKTYIDLRDIMPGECIPNVYTVTGGVFDADTGRIYCGAETQLITYQYQTRPDTYMTVKIWGVYDDIPIDDTHFPDEYFQAWCLEQTWGTDGVLTGTERVGIHYIDVSGEYGNYGSIQNMSGIEYFPGLTELRCGYNQITELDVSGCEALSDINCEYNKLIELKVTGCTELTYLACNDNHLTKLDVSGCAALTYLDCDSNNLIELNVTGCAALEYIYCSYNNLTELNVSTCTTLSNLSCEGNHIAALDLTLVDQDVYANLSPQSIAMPELRSDGQKTYINLLDIMPGECIPNVYTVTGGVFNVETGRIYCGAETQLITYQYQTQSDTYMTVKIWGVYDDIPIDDTHFPDAHFRAWCLEQTWGTDGVLTGTERVGVYSIYVSVAYDEYGYYGNIQNMSGIEYFPGLTELHCAYNQITELDVSGCERLEILYCYNNNLIELNVSGCAALMQLDCESNLLTDLDLSKCAALRELICADNRFAALDLTRCAELDYTDISPQDEIPMTILRNGQTRYLNLLAVMPETCIANISDVTGGTLDAETGRVILNEGVKAVTYQYHANDQHSMTVTLRGKEAVPTFTTALPAGLVAIEEDAFVGCVFIEVRVPDGCKAIGARAFKDCRQLVAVYIPGSVESIANGAFEGCASLTIYCADGSRAHEYAAESGLPYVLQ